MIKHKAIIDCLLEYSLTRLLLSMKIKFNGDFELFLFLTWSRSEYPSNNNFLYPMYMIPHLLNLFKYCSIIFMTFVYWCHRFFIKRLIMKIENVISGIVSTIKNMKESVIPWYYSFLEALTSFSTPYLKTTDSFIRVFIIWALLK